ncbi:MAG TPA: FAD-binding and (Fe-S)-binding domain-containing protein [Nocardioidaceae bacterium]|nr:FAD-binding and (Fe-S)-binding domain-containing protein [Nocardioidaceae bacterium]
MSDLAQALRRAGLADVDDSALARALYSSDASLYRVPPQVVVRPEHVDELDAVLSVSHDLRVPVTMRGAGTSIAGNAVGPGIVVDTSKHLHRIVDVDVEARTATVEPGVVHAMLQRRLAGTGLRFGPDPSTHTRCTIGGMIGNNACGSRALGYGRTADNVVALETTPVPDLTPLVDQHLGLIRTEFGRFSRQVSGYSLEHLLPENGRSVDRFLVGSEGTLAVVRRATVRLVEDAPHRVLVVLGFPDMAEAADAVPALLEHDLVACEGIDERITRLVPGHPELPEGRGWIFAEVTGGSEAEALAKAGRLGGRVVTDPQEQAALWRIREDGAGLASRAMERTGQSGWEDAAVPPERLGAYLRDFEALLAERGFAGAPYGHFGDGCVHIRIDFTLETEPGRADFRMFVEEAARLTASYGGSLSGEHGDGRARSELLSTMYSPEALALMGRVKALCDPHDLLNPGVLVQPRPLDADLRLASVSVHPDFHRCTGVGKCLADNTGVGGVMCPSYLATRNEKDSTRGRARVLQEMVDGRLVHGWDAPELEEALDLCLSCRGCAKDCPTGVDMATYKAQWLHEKYQGKRRPRSHYTLGRLPDLLRRTTPRLVGAGIALGPVAKAMAGLDQRRSLPRPARERAARQQTESSDVVIWLDTFTDRFAPGAAAAAARLLESLGQRVTVTGGDQCCGLTWISTGQLDEARRRLGGLLDAVATYDVPVVVLEPSCLAVLRHDAPHLLGRTAAARTLAEHLETLDWTPPDLSGTTVVAQPHCHHASVLGWDADERLLRRAGVDLVRVGGCCGMAGNFGMEKGHYEVSVAVAEHALLPAVRAHPGAVVLADGFSCRTQLADLADVPATTLAELLSERVSGPE